MDDRIEFIKNGAGMKSVERHRILSILHTPYGDYYCAEVPKTIYDIWYVDNATRVDKMTNNVHEPMRPIRFGLSGMLWELVDRSILCEKGIVKEEEIEHVQK